MSCLGPKHDVVTQHGFPNFMMQQASGTVRAAYCILMSLLVHVIKATCVVSSAARKASYDTDADSSLPDSGRTFPVVCLREKGL